MNKKNIDKKLLFQKLHNFSPHSIKNKILSLLEQFLLLFFVWPNHISRDLNI